MLSFSGTCSPGVSSTAVVTPVQSSSRFTHVRVSASLSTDADTDDNEQTTWRHVSSWPFRLLGFPLSSVRNILTLHCTQPNQLNTQRRSIDHHQWRYGRGIREDQCPSPKFLTVEKLSVNCLHVNGFWSENCNFLMWLISFLLYAPDYHLVCGLA